MNQPLRFSRVDTQEAFDEFVKFAHSFDHKEGDHTILPVYMIERDGEKIAYFKLLTFPIVLPAMHPGKCSPRDVRDIFDQVSAWQLINNISPRFPNGTGFISVENEPAISRDIIHKLGFRNLGSQLHQLIR